MASGVALGRAPDTIAIIVSTSTPAPATAYAVRGEDAAAITPPSAKPSPGTAVLSDSNRDITATCIWGAVAAWSAVSTATHSTPLPAPPTADAAQATSRLGDAARPKYASPIAIAEL